MLRIIKATAKEKQEYAANADNLYPLYGFVNVGGRICTIERLSPLDDMRYEVMAPQGYHFAAEGLHTLLCYSVADIRHRIAGEALELCDDEYCR